MFYSFRCDNEECEQYNEEVTKSLPMSERDSNPPCEKCEQGMKRVFKVGGIKTADGTK